ncbi:hypothetical protein CORC01_07960 [Colletotrichum orchidophilum]|uniref:Uncharacterized protein n=1 Tax=Colletotrichum orchidophilum TaxID=1209926 RepID=A0A1G4B5Y4_9PEZI|nr:uncharacterized protein CORC01_07960 [Colletotrichum orchidophilum]OHE96814.1 hypothetical protein CORC01_07960 [Colletotrichum orchidophilum]
MDWLASMILTLKAHRFARDEVRKEGYLFSAVAQRLIAHPEDADNVETMSTIAKRWSMTMQMMREILVGEAPELSPDDATPFDYYTAVDPRLVYPEEREEVFKVMGIEENKTHF